MLIIVKILLQTIIIRSTFKNPQLVNLCFSQMHRYQIFRESFKYVALDWKIQNQVQNVSILMIYYTVKNLSILQWRTAKPWQ